MGAKQVVPTKTGHGKNWCGTEDCKGACGKPFSVKAAPGLHIVKEESVASPAEALGDLLTQKKLTADQLNSRFGTNVKLFVTRPDGTVGINEEEIPTVKDIEKKTEFLRKKIAAMPGHKETFAAAAKAQRQMQKTATKSFGISSFDCLPPRYKAALAFLALSVVYAFTYGLFNHIGGFAVVGGDAISLAILMHT